MSNTSVFGGLLNGKTLYAYRLAEMTPLTLYEWVAENQINSLRVSIGMLRGLAALAETHPPLPSLRVIDSGGEVMRRPEVEQLCRLLPTGSKLVLRLASTEAGSYAHCMIEAGKPWHGEHTAIGTLTLNNQVLIVDENRQPVAVGQSGEIAVRSHFLAAGYWQRPAETAAKFLPDPDDCYLQTFFTGDTGRLLADGQLEFLGRTDFMVKIRGYRVQLEEVEAALTALPPIDEAVVVARTARSGGKQLIAYYTTAGALAPTASDLRRALLHRLPDYMIPARFVVVEKVPRGSTGKVDRAALPAAGVARPDLATPFVAPQNEQEQQIADIWAELLELDEVGIDDNFFELGGDSILAMRMLLNVEKAGISVKSTAFFQQPTVKTLAGSDTNAPAAAALPTAKRASAAGGARYSIPVLRSAAANRFARLMVHGPSGQKQHMSYRFGIRIQRALLAQSWVREKLYARQINLVRQWHAALSDQTSLAATITVSLLANTWVRWRSQALTTPTVVGKWLILTGQLAPLGGVVIAMPHVGRMIEPLLQIVQRHGRETAKVVNVEHFTNGQFGEVNPTQQLQGRSAQMWHAQQVLQRNGAAFIAADGLQGRRSIDLPLWGRRRPFQCGAAELAISTGSAFIPVYVAFDVQGRIHAEATAPLAVSAGSPEHQISELTEQYGAEYAQRWPQFYASLRWHLLAYTLALPQA